MEYIPLPSPSIRGSELLETILRRRSVREYRDEQLTMEELGVLLWSGYGCIDERCERRTVPSAGATYPSTLYVSVQNRGVEGLENGIYRYIDHKHALRIIRRGDYSRELYRACLDQEWVRDAPVNIIVAALPEVMTSWYGRRGYRYIYMEAGHIGQNIYLVATMLGLGTVAVGAFYDEDVREILKLSKNYMILYVMPIGRI